jgi:hypothetical protein
VYYVTIMNHCTNSMTVTEPSVDVPGVDATVTHDPAGKRFTVALKFPTGFALAPGQAAHFTAKTSLPQFPEVKVAIAQFQQPARAAALRRPRPMAPPPGGALPQPARPYPRATTPPAPPAPAAPASAPAPAAPASAPAPAAAPPTPPASPPTPPAAPPTPGSS